MIRHLPVIGLLAVVVGTSGCGYKAGGPFRGDIRTVYVDNGRIEGVPPRFGIHAHGGD